MKWLAVAVLVAVGSNTLLAQDRPADPGAGFKESDSTDGRWNQTDVGPFLHSVVPVGGKTGTIAKGLSIRVGDEQQGTVVYDTETMTCRAAWTGGFLEFDPARFGIVRAPKPAGPVQWHASAPAWGDAKVQFKGLHLCGKQVVLEYTVDGLEVFEVPWAFGTNPVVFTSVIIMAPHNEPERLVWKYGVVAGKGIPEPVVSVDQSRIVEPGNEATHVFTPVKDWDEILVTFGPADAVAKHAEAARKLMQLDVLSLDKLASRLWRQTLTTSGTRGADTGPYVVDTINVPFDNPWKALMFLAGLDFLPDGTAVVSTLHGDVWLVKGIDDGLAKVTWQRFATGLHQPLGVQVVGEDIFVLGRDQITRLHDRNNDGEADFYECFNNDGETSKGGHDFAACLEADPEGNLYYIRAHEGVCRVSKDGKKHESIAKGFRNPIGLGVSPTGMITAAPQEGTWTPKSAIFQVKPGGWYGFAGPQETADRPLGYDPPICWMPRLSDNSSGGQTWVTSEKFGPLAGRMLHLSYGQCAALLVMHEEVNGLPQGASLRLPMFFESGVMTGRTHPRDGQLYVAGLRGWQTAAAKDGCLQRVRYTGKPVHWPVEWHVARTGIEMKFASPLNHESATDPQNWAVEQWNYKYSKEYGSKDWLVSDPRKTGRDEVFIEEITLSEDGRTVFIAFEEDVEPVMQIGITYLIEAKDGTELKEAVYGTINAVPGG